MPTFGLAVTMKTDFRGAEQEFSNVFYYRSPTVGIPADPGPVITEIVNILKSLHSTQVQFVRSQLWSQVGSPSDNEMLDQRALTGTGNQVSVASLDRERAVLFQWPAGKDIRGKPVYLRKWFHSCGNCAGVTFGSDVLGNTGVIPQASRDLIATEANKLRIVGAADEWLLVARSGREHTGPGSCHRYLEHRQLGNMWR